MRYTLLFLLALLSTGAFTQNNPKNGVKESKTNLFAIKNATIYLSPEKKMENATIIIKGDKIIKVGLLLSTPKNATVIDYEGKVIVPAFIELNTNLGVANPKSKKTSPYPQLNSLQEGSHYWNEAIHPEFDPAEVYSAKEEEENALMTNGFGFALTHQEDGISRGNGAVIALGEQENKFISTQSTNAFFSFKKGVSQQTYPSSQMGSIALLRQALYDALWHQKNNEYKNISLDALYRQTQGKMYFSTENKYEILRAQKIADEFKLRFTFIGSGDEYAITNELLNLKSTLIIPINFPKAYDVHNPYVARQIPLSELKHWEMAPSNPRILANNSIPFCISSHQSSKDFWKNLRKAIEHGLTVEDALKALTTTPAKTIDLLDKMGSLEVGKFASFTVYDKDPFYQEAKTISSWNLGRETRFISTENYDITGNYHLNIDGITHDFKITGTPGKLKGEIILEKDEESKKIDAVVEAVNYTITIQFNAIGIENEGSYLLHGKIDKKLGVFEGDAILPDGRWTKWSVIKKGRLSIDIKKKETVKTDTTNYTWFPNLAYGYSEKPEQQSIVIKNATIWTNEEDGILKNATIVVKDGKIAYVGTGSYSTPSGATVIDAKGKHVTSGIIDEHSHIAISKGVNEGGQAITSEVSIADVLNPDDINIYRQLSGGVTCSQLLHGSANPIGGQSAVIKLKWGVSPEELKVHEMPKFIKFALGENVKQSNWGDYNRIRFPQTRMGVEQLYMDAFNRALKYKNDRNVNPSHTPIDLELEALVEILDKKRFVTCHSYVQSEINMLMHVADSFNFTLNTFTHILEGYKVADKMYQHGAGGSTFSDWWAYKYEVNDAIPYNAKLMADQGIVVAINSDDAEMGRRLNQEAAKSVKYGGMSEENAWKMVTLNPAKLLHLDDRMGSLKVGKDADIVLWSDHPLSINAIVEKTIVDGVMYYNSENNDELVKRNQAERSRIIGKMLKAKMNGEETVLFELKKPGHYHCNTIGEAKSTEENHH